MLSCNGSHVIYHRHKHGDSIYRCTLANAKSLLSEVLADDGCAELKAFVDSQAGETRLVRPEFWLARAFDEVLNRDINPSALHSVLCGGNPTESGSGEAKPFPVITQEMEDELVLYFYRRKLPLSSKTFSDYKWVPSEVAAHFSDCWSELSFLQEGRRRLGREIVFVKNHLYEGAKDLKVLLADRWRETAREENIVGNHFCPFLSAWGGGSWSVEPLLDA